MATANWNKRVVVEHRCGPKAGLREIAGLVSTLLERFKQPGLPSFCPKVDLGDRVADIELAKVETNYVLYRELVPSPPVDDGA